MSPYPPFLNLWYVISGKTTVPGVAGVVPEQRVTRAEALRFATEKCSWFIDLEGQVGSLAPGNYADLIVLNKDYFAVPEDEIRTLTSVLTVLGVAGGVAVALAGSRGLAELLYDISPTDPITITGAVILLAAVGLGGGLLASRRALSVDPAVALRNE